MLALGNLLAIRSKWIESHAVPREPVTTPTMLRGTQRIDTAVDQSFTSGHSRKTLNVSRTHALFSSKAADVINSVPREAVSG